MIEVNKSELATSIWNAKSVTRKRFLSITLTDQGDIPAAIRAVAEVFLIASEADKEPAAEEKQETNHDPDPEK